jgi:hypothetical protein
MQKPGGYSLAEKSAMRDKLKAFLGEEAQTQTGRNIASLGRRGVFSPGQAAGMATKTSADYGRGVGKGMTDIEIASTDAARRRKEFLMGQIGGASQGQFMPADNSFFDDISGFATDLSYYLNRPKGGGYDFLNSGGARRGYQSPNFNPGPLNAAGTQGGWYYDPLTGQYKRR